MGTIGAWVKAVMFLRADDHSTRPYGEESCKIGFVKMYHSKPVNLEVVRLLGYHGGNDLLPPV